MTEKPRLNNTIVRKVTGVAALALFSVLPEPLKAQFATLGWMHRVSHIAAFGVIFLILASGVKRFSIAATLALLLIGIGAALELLQTAVYGNALEYWDIRDDAVGVLLGVLLGMLLGVFSGTSRRRVAAIASHRIMASKSRGSFPS